MKKKVASVSVSPECQSYINELSRQLNDVTLVTVQKYHAIGKFLVDVGNDLRVELVDVIEGVLGETSKDRVRMFYLMREIALNWTAEEVVVPRKDGQVISTHTWLLLSEVANDRERRKWLAKVRRENLSDIQLRALLIEHRKGNNRCRR